MVLFFPQGMNMFREPVPVVCCVSLQYVLATFLKTASGNKY